MKIKIPDQLKNGPVLPASVVPPDFLPSILAILILLPWILAKVVELLKISDGIPEWWEDTKWWPTNRKSKKEVRQEPGKQIADECGEVSKSPRTAVPAVTSARALPEPAKELEQGQLALPLEPREPPRNGN